MPTHLHYCANRPLGCEAAYECRGRGVYNDGIPSMVCEHEQDPEIAWICDECAEAERCDWCGAYAHLETCEADCLAQRFPQEAA